jgi:hypothetical protein
MARSLLTFRLGYLLLLASASSMSACIIPAAPNFQDPPSVPDSPPYLSGFQPNNPGEIVTILPEAPGKDPQMQFSANVTDIDLGDTLYFQWVLDYPPFQNGVTNLGNQGKITPRLDGQAINTSLPELITCNFVGRPSDCTHQLELIVADRPFSTSPQLNTDNVLDSIDDPDGFVVRANWTIAISCSAIASSGAP